MSTLKLWAAGCSHVHTDIKFGRQSLADAIRHSECGGDHGGPSFDWDIMVHLGDLLGGQYPPTDADAQQVLDQFNVSREHTREHFYNVLGNHDGSGPDELCQWWFQKWIDPMGLNPSTSQVHPEHRPYPVEGRWERYSFEVGNVLFLMMSDRNDGGPPAGRGARGGYPAGKVTLATFNWWKKKVEDNRDKIIITCHHHLLKDTTVASGEWEGIEGGYHGRFDDGAPEGASYLYFVGDEPDAGKFEKYLADNPGAIALWLGGHTHANPDDTYGGKSHIEMKWGVTFINVAALTKHHVMKKTIPLSRLLTFVEGKDVVSVKCYLHTSDYAPQGWYDKAERDVPLCKVFSLYDGK